MRSCKVKKFSVCDTRSLCTTMTISVCGLYVLFWGTYVIVQVTSIMYDNCVFLLWCIWWSCWSFGDIRGEKAILVYSSGGVCWMYRYFRVWSDADPCVILLLRLLNVAEIYYVCMLALRKDIFSNPWSFASSCQLYYCWHWPCYCSRCRIYSGRVLSVNQVGPRILSTQIPLVNLRYSSTVFFGGQFVSQPISIFLVPIMPWMKLSHTPFSQPVNAKTYTASDTSVSLIS